MGFFSPSFSNKSERTPKMIQTVVPKNVSIDRLGAMVVSNDVIVSTLFVFVQKGKTFLHPMHIRNNVGLEKKLLRERHLIARDLFKASFGSPFFPPIHSVFTE